jgi:hypothetical protein
LNFSHLIIESYETTDLASTSKIIDTIQKDTSNEIIESITPTHFADSSYLVETIKFTQPESSESDLESSFEAGEDDGEDLSVFLCREVN